MSKEDIAFRKLSILMKAVTGGLLNVVSGKAKGSASHASETEHEVTFSVPLVWKQKGR